MSCLFPSASLKFLCMLYAIFVVSSLVPVAADEYISVWDQNAVPQKPCFCPEDQTTTPSPTTSTTPRPPEAPKNDVPTTDAAGLNWPLVILTTFGSVLGIIVGTFLAGVIVFVALLALCLCCVPPWQQWQARLFRWAFRGRFAAFLQHHFRLFPGRTADLELKELGAEGGETVGRVPTMAEIDEAEGSDGGEKQAALAGARAGVRRVSPKKSVTKKKGKKRVQKEPIIPEAGDKEEEEVQNEPIIPEAGDKEEEEVQNEPIIPEAGDKEEEEVQNEPIIPEAGDKEEEEEEEEQQQNVEQEQQQNVEQEQQQNVEQQQQQNVEQQQQQNVAGTSGTSEYSAPVRTIVCRLCGIFGHSEHNCDRRPVAD